MEVRRQFSLPLYGLNGLRGMFFADGQITRNRFRDWVASRDLPVEFPGVRGLGFIQRVRRADLAGFVAEQQADGSPGYAVETSGNAPDLYPVKYIEPLAPNRTTLGKDAGREAVRREAVERAVNGGLPALSGLITLTLGNGTGPGLLYFVPVYRGGSAAAGRATAEQRNANLIGLLFAPIHASEIMKGVPDVAKGTLRIELFEGDAAAVGNRLFDSQSDIPADSQAPGPRRSAHALQSLRRFVVGGRTLALRATGTAAFDASVNGSSVAFVAAGGVLASFIMALAVWLLAVGRVRAQRRAQHMTADLARLARVVQHTSNSVAITDAGMRINWVNEGFTRITGYSLAEAAGRTPGELLSSGKADPGTLSTLLATVAAGQPCRVEILNRAKDGREYWIDTEIQPMRDEVGTLSGFMEVGSDITAQKQAQSALRDSEAFLDRAGRIAGVGGWVVELRSGKIIWSDQTCRMHGVLPGHQPGMEEALAFFPPAARAVVESAAQEGIANGRPWDLELPLITATGRQIWVHAVGEVEFDDGEPVRLIGAFQEITERRALDQELKDALALAERASLTKSQFLANMSHEIRTPMNAILGMLSLLQRTSLTARQRDYTAKTEGAARSLLHLLNEILDFSKAEAGKMTLDPRPFRVDRLLRDLSMILSANVGAKAVDVLFDVDPAVPPCLLGDDLRLQQVLINLGGNAVKFTSDGEVVVSLRVVERGAQDVLLEFAVRDTGIGIAPGDQAHIFTGFSQAEASTTRRFGGTGLGLAISQRLVGLMGGELCLHSVPGEGSRFHFQIRLAIAEAFGDGNAAPQPALGAVRALIVDDSASAREVLAGMAQSLGWQVDVAASGAEGVALATARAAQGVAFETVFVDWKMPGMDGWETGRRMLGMAQAAGQPAPLIFMITSHGREMLAQHSAEDQSILSAFLVKPVTASILFDAVADARMALAQPGWMNRPAAPTPQRLAGMRLLVVEDNLNNQQVAQELLAQEGAQVALACDGQAGVDAVAAAEPPFDAVLMDVQMPVMDGYTATALIRRLPRYAALPIIAMTANAMASDRDACLAAGMNDHVGKPFDLSNLVAVLLHHTGRAAASATTAVDSAGAVAAELLEQADRRGIALAAALGRMGGNRRAYLRALLSFHEDLTTLPDRFAALLHRARFDEAGRLMHTLKGMAATLGVLRLASLAADTERALGGADAMSHSEAMVDPLTTLVVATMRDLTCVAEALRRATPTLVPTLMRDPAAGLAQRADLPELRRSLDELTGLLRGADMRALAVFERLQQTGDAQLVDALQPLDEAMASLDFDLAVARCQALGKRFDQ